MKYETAGDPMGSLKWTRKTTQKIAEELKSVRVEVSKTTVGNILKKLEITELRTQVDWQDLGLSRFFASTGFQLAPEQILERPVSRNL